MFLPSHAPFNPSNSVIVVMHWNLFRLPYLEDGLKGCIYIIGKCDLCCKKMLNLISLYNFFSRNLT